MNKLIKKLEKYRDKMEELVEKEARESGKECFKFDTTPFDDAIAILRVIDATKTVIGIYVKENEENEAL